MMEACHSLEGQCKDGSTMYRQQSYLNLSFDQFLIGGIVLAHLG